MAGQSTIWILFCSQKVQYNLSVSANPATKNSVHCRAFVTLLRYVFMSLLGSNSQLVVRAKQKKYAYLLLHYTQGVDHISVLSNCYELYPHRVRTSFRRFEATLLHLHYKSETSSATSRKTSNHQIETHEIHEPFQFPTIM